MLKLNDAFKPMMYQDDAVTDLCILVVEQRNLNHDPLTSRNNLQYLSHQKKKDDLTGFIKD